MKRDAVSEQSANACYSCGYSLKGLALADGLFKCPECGALQTISYTTAPKDKSLHLVRKHPLVLLSPVAVSLAMGATQWLAPRTIFATMFIVVASLWTLFIPALYLLISIVMCFFSVPGRMQRIVFFAAWLALGVLSMFGVGLLIDAFGR